VTPLHRIGLAIPLIGLSALTLGVSLIGARGLWDEYSSGERFITVLMCLMTGLSLGISVAVAVDRRIDSLPWRRIIAIAVLLVLSCGVAVIRRELVLSDV
jgi:hypothetical protein